MLSKILSTFWTNSSSLEEVRSNLGGCGRFRGFFFTKGTGATCCAIVIRVSGGGGGGGGGGGAIVPPSPLPSPSRSGGGVRCLRISSSISAEIPPLHLLVVFSRSLSLRLLVVVVQSRVSIDSLLFSQLFDWSSCSCLMAFWLQSWRLCRLALIWSNSACAEPIILSFSSPNLLIRASYLITSAALILSVRVSTASFWPVASLFRASISSLTCWRRVVSSS